MEKPVVLLADDDEEDVQMMRSIFGQLGLEECLYTVEDGAEAIDYLAGLGRFSDRTAYPLPSLLILDMVMPKRSGEEVVNWLKGKPHLQRMFVVIMTGVSRRLSPEKMFERYGNIVFLNHDLLKPASVESIGSLVVLFESWMRNGPTAAPHEEGLREPLGSLETPAA